MHERLNSDADITWQTSYLTATMLVVQPYTALASRSAATQRYFCCVFYIRTSDHLIQRIVGDQTWACFDQIVARSAAKTKFAAGQNRHTQSRPRRLRTYLTANFY